MNLELAAAKGQLRELELQEEQAKMAVEEERRHLREATGPMIATHSLDSTRIAFLAARLINAIEDLKRIGNDMATIREGYNL
jgi:hypothetical protein